MARLHSVRMFHRGKIWWLSYWHEGERVRESTGSDNRRVAESMRREKEARLVLEILEPVRRKELGAFVEEYFRYSKTHKRKKTYHTDLGRIRPFLDSLGVKYLGEVTTPMVMRYLIDKIERDGIQEATQLRIRECLHAMFEYARMNSYIQGNPVSPVPRPHLPEKDIRFLRPRDIEAVLEVVRCDYLEPIVRTCIYAGLRREEMCWLTWDDLILFCERPLMRIRSKVVDGVRWVPKTRKNRTVPIHRKELQPLYEDMEIGRDGVQWVIPSPQGVRWDPDNLSARFRRLMKREGLPWNLLDLRHTFGSRLAQAGRSLYEISMIMGNSPEICRKHYAQLLPEFMHERVEV